MPQLHFSLDDHTAKVVAARAAARGMSLSRYLSELVRAEVAEQWPAGYLTGVIGSCADAPLSRPPQLELGEVDL